MLLSLTFYHSLQIVNNLKCKMDVDKWDSYARDCFQLGIPNNFDHLRYIKFCCVLYHEESDQKVLCAREKVRYC